MTIGARGNGTTGAGKKPNTATNCTKGRRDKKDDQPQDEKKGVKRPDKARSRAEIEGLFDKPSR